ncbi:OprO/OprP family phosphate-selective porin [Novosphingobium soli]|uniref:Porin n=1 Tax=Novosphingobium soli TaxID=574956 RepID=A0ABV6CPL4_9SPHN
MRTPVAAAAAALAVAAPLPAFAQAIDASEAAALRSQIRELRERLEALESRLAAQAPGTAAPESPAPDAATAPIPALASVQAPAPAPAPAATPSPAGGKAFKMKGRIQADAGIVSAPSSLEDQGLGFSSEMRRIRLGAEGELSPQFSYKLEVELSDNAVDLVDTFLTFEQGRWQVRVGNQNAFWSLDELTGDTSGSVMERAAFTDAFAFERRLGLGVQYTRGPLIAQLGVFTDDITALANSSDGTSGGDENNSYSVDGRLVLNPRLGAVQLHLGGSAHWRRLGRLADASIRYRQRPFLHTTNTRLIGTPALKVEHETMYGLELAAIAGRWHGAGEYYALTADRVGASPLTFRGAYAELGYFLTRGDSRGYKGGIFTNNAPARPLGEGGPGSIQVNLRYDWLDLNDRDVRGGTQDAYIAGLIWTPIRNLRFHLDYALLRYTGATALPSGDDSYDANVIGTRFELDF